MTTIVMIETDHDVLIAYDSRLTGGNNKDETPDNKVFVNGGAVYGMSGSTLHINALRYATLPQAVTSEPARWVTNTLLPAIRKLFDTIETDDSERSVGILVVVNGEVFEIHSRLGWSRNTRKHYAIGSGSYYALGALSAGASHDRAVSIAAEHDQCTGDTIHATTANTLLAT